jgi:release factor glutamine methyltransferase
LLLDQIKKLSLENKKLLELGAGSGLISIYAAQHGAVVTATDINPTAVKYLYDNCEANNVRATILESDLFDRVPEQVFDIIAINPPYYKRDPKSPADYAWFCGENGEYFAKLFGALKNYTHPETIVLMILCDGCDIDMVKALASEKNFDLKTVYTRQNVLEKNFIYSIDKKQ